MMRVFSEYYYRTYSAPIYSYGSFCCLIGILSVIFIPFMLLIISPQFWLYTSSTFEQPKASLTGEIFLSVLTTNSSRSYCSISSVNQAFSSQSLSPIIQTSHEDYNNDGLNDFMNLKITLPTSDAALIRQVNLVLGVSYGIQQIAYIDWHSAIFLTFTTPAGASYIKSMGELKLNQRGPFYPSKSKRTLYDSARIFTEIADSGYASAFDLCYMQNDTLDFARTDSIGMFGDSGKLEIEVKIVVPPSQEILYQQPFFEILKLAWVQYVAFFVTIYAIIYYGFFSIAYHYQAIQGQTKDDATLNSIEKIKKY